MNTDPANGDKQLIVDGVSRHQPLRRSLGTRLFVAGALLVLVTGLVVALVGATIARQGVLAEAERRVLALAEQRESHLSDRLDAYFDTATRLVQTIQPSVFSGTELHNVLFSLPGLHNVSLLTDEGLNWRGSPHAIWHPDPTALNAASLSRAPAYGPLHRQADGTPVFDVILPIAFTADGDSALLAMRIDSREVLDPIMTDTSGLGQRGELFLLDRDMRMLTPSRQHSHPEPLMHIMDIPPARAAIAENRGSMQYTSFLGDPVVGGYVYMPRQRWILVGELDVREALTPVRGIYERTAIILGFALLLLLAVTLILARNLAQPIVKLTRASELVAAGKYDVHVSPPPQRNELYRLTESFNRMTGALHAGREELAIAQQRLVQQETIAAIGRLVASIVHEMRNPLSSIKMNLRLLERQVGSDDMMTEHLGLAQGEATRLETMLQELLDYGKPVEPRLEQLALNEIARAAKTELQNLADETGVEIHLRESPQNPVALGDRELLRRILENLLRNATEACSTGDVVQLSVETTADSGTVVLSVRDTGHGMTESVRDRVFDPFFTTRNDGTGLGMANVKKFVELMVGELKLESVEGEGTTVTVELPGGTP
jgi:signal transduction histidine kinase